MITIKEGSNLKFKFTNVSAQDFFVVADPIKFYVYDYYGENNSQAKIDKDFAAPAQGASTIITIELKTLSPGLYLYELFSNFDEDNEQSLKQGKIEIENVRSHAL